MTGLRQGFENHWRGKEQYNNRGKHIESERKLWQITHNMEKFYKLYIVVIRTNEQNY